MKINGTEIPIEARDVFLLLYGLLCPGQGGIDLPALRKRLPRMSEDQAWIRASLLAEHLNIPEGREQYVAEELAKILSAPKDKSRLPRALLSKAIRAAAPRPAETASPLRRYTEKALRLLRRSPVGFVDESEGGLKKAERGAPYRPLVLDTGPVARRWPREIIESPAWNRIESPVPGVPDLPLEDTWVNLTLREMDFRTARTAASLESDAWNELSFDRPGAANSLHRALSKVQGLTVILGLPGAGKSTLMKWIARHLVTDVESPFGIPVLISLRQYARERARRPDLSLLEYFLRSRGVKDAAQIEGWRSVVAGLLDPPGVGSDTPETFLWLLDGWDEVPPEMRDSLLPEIQSVALYPSIITTRHSGDLLRLPAQKYYEIQGLTHGAALDLASRWLARTGRSAYYAAIEAGLEESDELRRMARSPFLLTLICALVSDPSVRFPGRVPARRGDVLRETLRLVFDQHNADPKQAAKFGRRDREDVSRFAFWLLAEAPGAPRYVFDGQDYEAATSRERRFDSLLVPSRLIARPAADAADFQFLHISFQEYLAAQNLLRTPGQIPRGGALLLNQVWKEVARFLAETATAGTEAWDVLWDEARLAVKNLDRFGLVAARVALLLAAASQRDGGGRLLGVDVRDHLWRVLKRYAAQVPTQPLEAFLELDPTGLARRILDHRIRTGKNSLVVSWLEHISVLDLEMLFTDHEKYRKVLALPEVAAFCPELPQWVRGERPGLDDDPQAKALLDGLRKAIAARDIDAAKAVFWDTVEEGFADTAVEGIQLFESLSNDDVTEFLLEVATSGSADALTRAKAVSSLAELGDRNSCQRLIRFLASRDVNDPACYPILANLEDYSLSGRETKLMLDFLRRSKDPDIRSAAAELLPNTRSRDTAASMMGALKAERGEDVRLAILEALAAIADDVSLDKLWGLREGKALKNDAEWELWFRAVLITSEKRARRFAAFGGVQAADALSLSVRDWATRALTAGAGDEESVYSKLTPAAVKFPGILGKAAACLLKRVAENEKFPEGLRVAAINNLAQVGGPESLEFLARFARGGKGAATDPLRRAACDALGQLSPAALARLKSRHAEVAMARLAFRFNTLFMASGHASEIIPNQTPEVTKVMPEPQEKRVKILLFNASPAGMDSRQLDEEKRAIEQKILQVEHRDLLDLVTFGAARPDDLLLALNMHRPQVVQFSGHASDRDEIILCDDSGSPRPVTKDALVTLFRSVPNEVQVVLLNACYSKAQAEAVISVVPCAVGMDGVIGIEASRVFAASFYRAIGFGHSIQTAFDQGIAALKLEGIPAADMPRLLNAGGVEPSQLFLLNPTQPTLA